MDVGSDGVPGCVKTHARRSHRPRKIGVKAMSTLFDILKKDRNGTFQWLETVNDIEIAKARVLKLSSGSLDEFVIFRGNDLQVVATSQAMQTDTQVLGDLLEV
jgi:hypothetical protein